MKLFKYFCLLSFMASCSSEQTPQELLSVDLRSGMDHPSMLALQDEIESVDTFRWKRRQIRLLCWTECPNMP